MGVQPSARTPWPDAGLTDAVVALRRFEPADADQFVALFDAEARRWSPPVSDGSEQALRERVDRACAAPTDGPPPGLAIVDASEPSALLGSIDWRQGVPIPPFSVVDVGYTTGSWARGRGVATRALRLLSDWLMAPEGLDLHRVQLDHAVAHGTSCRVAVRAGFAVEGQRAQFLPLRESPRAPIVFHDICQHARLRG